MKYQVQKSFIQVIGKIWMPAITCAQDIELRQYDIDNMKNEDGEIDRESVESWLGTNTGDFQNIEDFRADIEDGEKNIIIDWEVEESEYIYSDCMY